MRGARHSSDVDVQQSAFNPANVVPGIGFSPDKMLQGRLFSYGDAQRYRLGTNHHLIPVNAPRCPVHSYHRDGPTPCGWMGTMEVRWDTSRIVWGVAGTPRVRRAATQSGRCRGSLEPSRRFRLLLAARRIVPAHDSGTAECVIRKHRAIDRWSPSRHSDPSHRPLSQSRSGVWQGCRRWIEDSVE